MNQNTRKVVEQRTWATPDEKYGSGGLAIPLKHSRIMHLGQPCGGPKNPF